jgi:uncharacterized protein YegP (UPF0339 family)
MGIYVEFYRSKRLLRRPEWRWRIMHDNGNQLARSSEGYERKVDCKSAFNTIRNRLLNAPTMDVGDDE